MDLSEQFFCKGEDDLQLSTGAECQTENKNRSKKHAQRLCTVNLSCLGGGTFAAWITGGLEWIQDFHDATDAPR